MKKLCTILIMIMSASFVTADEYGDLNYPVKLSAEQKSALTALSNLSWQIPPDPKETEKWKSQRTQEWEELLASLSKLDLPKLATAEDIRVTKDLITNASARDLLVVIAHETGRDIAHRTHWLKAGKSIPNKSIYMGGSLPCRILWPKQEREQGVAGNPLGAPKSKIE